MAIQKPATWAYTEEFLVDPLVVEAARRRGEALGAPPVPTSTGAALRLLAATKAAKTVVEVGTGAGVSGLWLLEGMPADGVLTTIDIEAAHSKTARSAFAEAGIPTQRTRCIVGDAMDVLPRLTDGAYDMVHIDADKERYPEYAEQAIRLLSPGGVLALDNMLWKDKVADPAARDQVTGLLRNLGKQLRDDERLFTTMLPVGDGLLVAVRR
ncbi:MAG: O-methyltransferase [Austwickia sp.]|nr:O-methyltransferase [Austwickia sp.]MBK8435987.1 O-methyltransferase [Austwickia sp.]MBK9101666.1 O-methyltransferase [Austwickia sp.]